MQDGIDKGFCLSFSKLSYRRKLIRTIWILAVCIPIGCLAAALSDEKHATDKWAAVVAVLILGGGQVIYSYYKWQNETNNK